MKRMGIPFVISAPSGAGKTSLVKALVAELPDIVVSISHTTRAKRPREKEGVNYHFVDEKKFTELMHENIFLEYARVFGNFYGTSSAWVAAQLEQGKDVIFEIDWQGAQQIRQKLLGCFSIFILPPSLNVLQDRLSARGQDDVEIIKSRMNQAKDELSHYAEFDYLVVNDNFNIALEDIKSIIRSARLNITYQKNNLAGILESLLGDVNNS